MIWAYFTDVSDFDAPWDKGGEIKKKGTKKVYRILDKDKFSSKYLKETFKKRDNLLKINDTFWSFCLERIAL